MRRRPSGLAAAAGLLVAGMLAAPAPAVAQAQPCDRPGWEALVSEHLAAHQLLGVEDMYKLLHQGVFGTEHAAPDVASARTFLEQEIAALRPLRGGHEPVVEPIAPGGRVVRVHLRPYLDGGGDPEALLVAFLETAVSVRGSVEELTCAAEVVERVTGDRWASGVWRAFVARMVEERLPAIHHSGPFEATYRPAYRVVAGDLLPLLGLPAR